MKTNRLLVFQLICLVFQFLLANCQNKDATYRQALIGVWIVSQESDELNVKIEVEYDKYGNYKGDGIVITKADNIKHPIHYTGSWSITNNQLTEKLKQSNVPGLLAESTCTILSITPEKFAFLNLNGTNAVVYRKIEGKSTAAEIKSSSNSTSINITQSDVALAKEIIEKNAMSLPGMAIGSMIKYTPGPFCPSDALIIYMLKFHQLTKSCPPLAFVIESLQKLDDIEFNKKSAAIFWQMYCSISDVDVTDANFLSTYLDLYCVNKLGNRFKMINTRLEGFVASEEAWSKAMKSQQQSWQKSTERQIEYILNRDAYRVVLNSQAAVDAAARAVSGGY